MEKVRVGIAGVTGRMGSTLVRVALETPGIALGAASSHSQDELVVGRDAGLFSGGEESGVAISGSLEYCHGDFDVAIDFTCPEYTVELARFCVEQEKGMVIGTTAHSKEQLEAVTEAAKKIPIVMAPNMSIGVNLMLNLITEAAKALGDETDTDIVELHHRKSTTPRLVPHWLWARRWQKEGNRHSQTVLRSGLCRRVMNEMRTRFNITSCGWRTLSASTGWFSLGTTNDWNWCTGRAAGRFSLAVPCARRLGFLVDHPGCIRCKTYSRC